MQNFRLPLAGEAAVLSPTKMLIPALAMLTSSRQNPHATPLPDVSNHFAEVDATQKALIVDRSGQYTTDVVLVGEVAAEFAMLVAACSDASGPTTRRARSGARSESART